MDVVTPSISLILNAISLAKIAVTARDEGKRQEAIREIEKTLISSHKEIMAEVRRNALLEEENRALKQRCVQLEKKASKEIEYPFTELALNVFARVKHQVETPLCRRHKLCADCFEKEVYATLKQSRFDNQWFLSCHECGLSQQFENFADE